MGVSSPECPQSEVIRLDARSGVVRDLLHGHGGRLLYAPLPPILWKNAPVPEKDSRNCDAIGPESALTSLELEETDSDRQRDCKQPREAPGLRTQLHSLLRFTEQRRLLRTKRTRRLWLLAGCLFICIWQLTLALQPQRLDSRFLLTASSGIHAQTYFLYFYHYLGLFPIATEQSPQELEFSRAGAERQIADHGESLLTEWGHTTRYGELGKMFLYLPSIWLNGWKQRPNMRVANGFAFILSLLAVFVSFCKCRQPLLGALLVLFMGSNPFQLFELYGRQLQVSPGHPYGTDNVFGWVITTALFALALNLPLYRQRCPGWYQWAAPALTGLLVATVSQVRTEPVAVVAMAALSYLLLTRSSWAKRFALIAVLGATLVIGGKAWNSWFRTKIAQAEAVVQEANGHVYPGPRDFHHLFWHPIWVGLGDFDPRFAWRDKLAAEFVLPILKEKYGINYTGGFWDQDQKFYRQIYELDHFGEVLRDDLVARIGSDPLWYAGILCKRAWRILTETSPLRLTATRGAVTLPMHGLLMLPVLGLLIWCRAWTYLAVLVLSCATSLTAFAVYSGHGTCLYSIYHLVVAALVVACLIEWLLRKRRVHHLRKATV